MGIMSFLFGCVSTKKTTVYSADCNNAVLSLNIVEEQKYSWSGSHLELSWNKHPPIRVGYSGLPNNESLFKDVPHVYFDTSVQMINTAHGKTQKQPVLFYVDPTVFSQKDFEALAGCLQLHYKPMEDTLSRNFVKDNNYFQYPQLAGMVYAKQSDFDFNKEVKP